ncbi:hypothetical protein Sjap_015503 [Stephania japonica]|uniref:Uncharacterized protein n=1 Tax=Stephania japonica TaxID=461633 RepID=A0AAP0IJ85_9MAGN
MSVEKARSTVEEAWFVAEEAPSLAEEVRFIVEEVPSVTEESRSIAKEAPFIGEARATQERVFVSLSHGGPLLGFLPLVRPLMYLRNETSVTNVGQHTFTTSLEDGTYVPWMKVGNGLLGLTYLRRSRAVQATVSLSEGSPSILPPLLSMVVTDMDSRGQPNGPKFSLSCDGHGVLVGAIIFLLLSSFSHVCSLCRILGVAVVTSGGREGNWSEMTCSPGALPQSWCMHRVLQFCLLWWCADCCCNVSLFGCCVRCFGSLSKNTHLGGAAGRTTYLGGLLRTMPSYGWCFGASEVAGPVVVM